jgi:hypothetical protein
MFDNLSEFVRMRVVLRVVCQLGLRSCRQTCGLFESCADSNAHAFGSDIMGNPQLNGFLDRDAEDCASHPRAKFWPNGDESI